jgi:large subunit ribosomal protein L4
VVDELRLTENKTKRVAKLLHDLALEDAPVLIVIDAEEPFLEASARNLPNVSVLRVAGLNVYDVLRHRKLLLTRAAVDAIGQRLRGEPAEAAS